MNLDAEADGHSARKLAILVVEGDQEQAELIRDAFGNSAVLTVVSTLAAARSSLAERQPDLLIADLHLAAACGAELLPDDAEPAYPLIVLISDGDQAAAAIKSGAQDYVLKSPDALAQIRQSADRVLRQWRLLEERRIADIALRQSESVWRSTVENMPILVMALDRENRIIVWNRRCESVTGYSSAEVQGNAAALACLYPSAPIRHRFLAWLRQRREATAEWETIGKDGLPRVISWTAIAAELPVHGWDVWSVGIDVTARKHAERERAQLEAQLRHAHKMETIGLLASGFAHEFSNKLQAVLSHTQVALERPETGPELHRDLEQILSSAGQARDLVQQILVFRGRSRQDRRTVSMGQEVEFAVSQMRARLPAGAELRAEIDAGTSLVLADAEQLHQVVTNLLANALQAIGDGGLIDVSVDAVTVGPEFARTCAELTTGDYLRLAIRDNGCGIPPDVVDHIFEPFFTAWQPAAGTGLGLAVVRSIVSNHGGAIRIETGPGCGTLVEVYLPQQPDDQTGAQAAPTGQAGQPRERILYVDDEESIASLVEVTIGREGYDVITRHDGREALKVFSATPERFDLVITDQTMPYLRGTDLAAEIHRIRPDLPIILMSGFGEADVDGNMQELGIQEFVTKPVFGKDLNAVIRRVLDAAAVAP